MNSDNKSNVEPSVSKMLDPYSNPRTIPGGWDVSAFYAPETDNVETYGEDSHTPKSGTATTEKND